MRTLPFFCTASILVSSALGQQTGTLGAREDSRRKEVEELLSQTRDGDAFRLLQVATLAARYDLLDSALVAADRALSAQADEEKVAAILRPLAERDLAGQTGARRSTRAQQLLNGVAKPPATARALYTRLALESIPAAEALDEMGRSFTLPSPAARRFVVEEWGRLAAPGKLEPVVKRSLCDPDAGVREAAAKTLGARPTPAITARFARALAEPSASLRLRSTEALGLLGQPEAIPALAKHLGVLRQAAASTYAPRASFFVGTQQAYVSDYNVEVAQAAAIAEPQIDVLQSGVVLDVRVLGVQAQQVIAVERRAVHDALVKLAGVDLGEDPKAWARWYDERRRAAEGPVTPETPASRRAF